MLTELHIKNFAIIDEIKVSFGNGLNVITGETGAGKSIIIGAAGLIFGDRASTDLIRSSEETASVEALFDISKNEQSKERLMRMGFHDGDELIVKRVVTRSGKNKVYINGNLATLNMLSTLAESLINISGQHEHQILLNTESHIDILDEFGDLLQLRTDFSDCYNEYLATKTELERLKLTKSESDKHEELLRFQLKEIMDAGIVPDEDLSLLREKNILNNAKKLTEYVVGSYEILYGRQKSILAELGGIVNNIKEAKKIDPGLKISEQDIDSLLYNLEDVALTLREYAKDIHFDPDRLEEIEQRLEYLGKLKRKYGGTLKAALDRKVTIEEELEGICFLDEDIRRLSEEVVSREALILEKSNALSSKRRETARLLKEAVEAEIHSLKMTDTQFEVIFKGREGKPVLSSKGMDMVEFYLSANAGEELKPLNRIASGGELSRIVLAMKRVLARVGAVETIVFDEVDTGIGGDVAGIVGKKLKEVSKAHQVICITHLPQIACFAKNHYRVSKDRSGERVSTRIFLLSEAERLDEITRMLSGVKATEKTREHALEMLKTSCGR